MNKLKQVFSSDEHKSPSGHFTTESSDEAHRSSNDSNSRSTGSEILNPTQSTTDRSTTHDSTHNHGTTPSSTSAGDRVADAAAGAGAAAASSSSTSRSPTTATHGTGIEGKMASAAEHVHEHAHPPGHRHSQPAQDGILSEKDAKLASHDHQHLAPVTHETRHHHEIEEIERQREVDRHVHHVQHHTQPVLDTQHASEVYHEKAVPVTKIKESHVATDEDHAQFAALNTAKDSVVEAPREKTIVDLGEKVVENTSHHVHHVVQPVIERDTHEHHRIHTVIPTHQTTHEAPIVHSSISHEPMSLKDFTAGGGDLASKLKHDANLLIHKDNQNCERTVDGPAETLTHQFGLTSLNDKTSGTSAAPTSSMNTATTGRSSTAAGTTGGTL
ncbi:hypothetical protein JCM6882_005305 [Rhodosporidiobolus microsporus]